MGKNLLEFLAAKGAAVRGLTRHAGIEAFPCPVTPVGDFSSTINWAGFLENVDVIVHCAARVHMMRDRSSDQLAEFRRVNVAATLDLARSAAQMGVRRFVFLSSIKVNGDSTTRDRPFSPHDTPAPKDPYGVSKYEAECGLKELAAVTGMEVVIIRPVLVYGPGVKGNFLSMLQWVARGVPLPLGAVRNKRSLVGVTNLVDLIARTTTAPNAANNTFLVSDGNDLSTPELLRLAGRALGRNAVLLDVPEKLLKALFVMSGRQGLSERILDSLQVDTRETTDLLGWAPPSSVEEELRRTVAFSALRHLN